MKNFIKKITKRNIILFSVVLILLVVGISLAKQVWTSGENNTVFDTTIGDIAGINFNPGDNINVTDLAPVLDYHDGASVKFEVFNKSGKPFSLSIFLNIINIDEALKNDSFKYILTKYNKDTKIYDEVQNGTFKDVTAGKLNIYDDNVDPNYSYYIFYIYIDGNMENDINMMNKNIHATLGVEGKTISIADNMKLNAKSDEAIRFYDNPSSNESGIYMRSGTENNPHPIYYYRGKVDNNNVLFANHCWKIVLTTPTGGTKLIYNGKPSSDNTCNNTGSDSTIGESYFDFNVTSASSASYMYGTKYTYGSRSDMTLWYSLIGKTLTTQNILTEKNDMSNTNYYYGDTATYDSANQTYTLSNSNSQEVLQHTWSNDYENLKGYYSCLSNTETSCKNVYYISGTSSTSAYYFQLSNGKLANNYVLSNSVTYNQENNTYTLSSDNLLYKKDYYENYENYNGYYYCSDYSTSCSTIYYINSTTNSSAKVASMTSGETYNTDIEKVNNLKWAFGNDVSYNSGTYTLMDNKLISPSQWSTSDNYNGLTNNHYTCFNENGTCTALYYVYYTTTSKIYYIRLTNGKKIENALTEMLDTHTKDSTIKTIIDDWYEKNLAEYTDKYIEDTVYCNDKSTSKNEFNPNGGNTSNEGAIIFASNGRQANPNVECPRNEDKFTVSNQIGNGSLKYPVGLLTYDEVILSGATYRNNNSYYLNTGDYWWTATPNRYNYDYTAIWYINESGVLAGGGTSNNLGVRPVISLKPNIGYSQGEGTEEKPYVIK